MGTTSSVQGRSRLGSSGVVRSHLESTGVIWNHPELIKVGPRRPESQSSGIIQSWSMSVGVNWSLLVQCTCYQGSHSVELFWLWLCACTLRIKAFASGRLRTTPDDSGWLQTTPGDFESGWLWLRTTPSYSGRLWNDSERLRMIQYNVDLPFSVSSEIIGIRLGSTPNICQLYDISHCFKQHVLIISCFSES